MKKNRNAYLAEIRRFDAERVFLATGVYKLSVEEFAIQMKKLSENAAFFKANGLEVGAWFWTFNVDEKSDYVKMRTISGGEPLFQPDFTAELLKNCRENGIHTAIETSGFDDEKTMLAVIEHCDLVLFDIKETDEERHRRYTGVPLKPILRNLATVNERGIPFVIRAPIIPTFNERESHFRALSTIRDSMEFCKGIQIMPYHKIGSYKYELLNRDYGCGDVKEPDKETVEAWNKFF